MALGAGCIPWVDCPACGYTYLLTSGCGKCGRSYWQAELDAKGINPHIFEGSGGPFNYCTICEKVEDLPYHVQPLPIDQPCPRCKAEGTNRIWSCGSWMVSGTFHKGIHCVWKVDHGPEE